MKNLNDYYNKIKVGFIRRLDDDTLYDFYAVFDNIGKFMFFVYDYEYAIPVCEIRKYSSDKMLELVCCNLEVLSRLSEI